MNAQRPTLNAQRSTGCSGLPPSREGYGRIGFMNAWRATRCGAAPASPNFVASFVETRSRTRTRTRTNNFASQFIAKLNLSSTTHHQPPTLHLPPTTLRRRSGATLVELLVVCLIVTIMAVSVGRMLAAALALEQRYRRESDVMESLADTLAYAERYYSLASDVTTNRTATYPLEAGGVSFETNHWMRVSGVSAFPSNRNFAAHIVSADPSHPALAFKEFSADGKQRIAPARVTVVEVLGDRDMRRIRIEATGVEPDGESFTVEAERPVRLWNLE